ncbi:hypothetical protein CLAFUW4_03961 [Fulvia fulva]|uniref:Uncharacterized protein n=1 Tax=Passalora fulva TaxID=5499 RepID=A0A9Q8LGK3_PASFU|nr:uncharacterized protein CLAFUR5_03926 [Fulvia fulva]KAK4626620.1 hypothetical protein CLAFUR4_03947 [Fulvia fulva]KAK4628665.1 hypothetical protein CLAFUR0_03948 [Fulvia fulva]UJO17005.1 hypothetical protein CLAFUR5_03926 [Fulvia fulva]WPV13174.1 hypothetical protein CLAFUW4_03961 [Fulvia fulva]WPV29053.1 hypothetical protein CLAFUW7_03950 [Fulvia fulva]
MAVPRDPAFWKRFSVAVHEDEETGTQELKSPDSWLARQNKKKSQRTYCCYGFWIGFLIFIAAVVAVIIWLLSSGMLTGDHQDVTEVDLGGDGSSS